MQNLQAQRFTTKLFRSTANSGILLRRSSNRAGGIEGGITNGEPLVIRAAMKPISTTLQGLASIDLATGQKVKTIYERSDICAVPRAAVVAEAMVSLCYRGRVDGKAWWRQP